MKKPTSTFWICLSILVAGFIIGAAIYHGNRYVFNPKYNEVIDTYTSTSREVK
ncbi:MAG: hypothetical protein K0M50_09945 [Prolixibacteraceae bacterium]|nr:hypothetical protein [Prolixibacteraceae bacterium]